MIADAGSVAVTVTDDDATTVTLVGAAGDMTEGGSKTSTVTLGRGLMNGESLAVPLSFSGGATRGTDYTMSGAAATGVTYQNLNSGDATVTFTGPESGGETVVIGLGGGASGTDNLAEFSINDATTNTAPTGADKTVTTNEDTAYTFAAADFGFAAADAGDTLSSVKITTLESAGDLELDGAGVTVNQAIMKADIDDGDLTFTPAANVNGTGYATFGFKVNDNKVDSTAAYTMTINVTAVNDAPTDVPTITGTVTQGQTLTAVTSAIADPDGLGTFSYQ